MFNGAKLKYGSAEGLFDSGWEGFLGLEFQVEIEESFDLIN